ncbi:MAG: PT domain-containing protein [Clostridia bacterium]|nr:PT domain-containing protein [Clostridia bacterium]
MKKFISMLVVVVMLASMMAINVSAAPAFQFNLDFIGGALANTGTAVHGGEAAFVAPTQCAGCSHPTYDTIYPGQFITLSGWFATDAGVDHYEYSLDGGNTWGWTNCAISDRTGLADYGVLYPNGHSTAGFDVKVDTTYWELGSYDVMIAAVDKNDAKIPFFTFAGVDVVEDTFNGEVTDISQITYGRDYKLMADIEGGFTFTEGNYSINLNGHAWTSDGASLTVDGANVSFYGGGDIYVVNDAIVVNSGSVSATGITVTSDDSGCDAFFIKGGSANIEDCQLSAQNACVHNDSRHGASVWVSGGEFEAPDVFKVRNNGTIEVTNLVGEFQVNIHKQCSADWDFDDAFVPGYGYKVEFDNTTANRTDIDASTGLTTDNYRAMATFAELVPGETEELPVDVFMTPAQVTVPAGQTYYVSIMNRGDAADLTVEGETGFVVGHNGDHEDVNGVVEELPTTGNMFGQIALSITNNTNSDQTYTLTLTPSKGTMSNPLDMIIGTNTVATTGSWNGQWLKWTAPSAGKLTITMNCDMWLYEANVNGMSVTDNMTHYCDDNPVVDTLEVEVEEGDVFMISVNTYDPETSMNPAADVVFEAAFESDEQPTEQPSEQPSEEPSEQPSEQPSEEPSEQPSEEPSEQPSEEPSEQPSEDPSEEPETDAPATDVPATDVPEIDVPETGDSSVTMFAVIAMMAAAAFVATVVLKKRAR